MNSRQQDKLYNLNIEVGKFNKQKYNRILKFRDTSDIPLSVNSRHFRNHENRHDGWWISNFKNV